MLVDLHMHTVYSDGVYSPSDVVAMAINSGVDVISITDHDTIDGTKEIVGLTNFNIISGVEITTQKIGAGLTSAGKVSIHILGYGIDLYDAKLNEALSKREKNKQRIIQEFLLDLVCAGAKEKQIDVKAKHGEYIQISDMRELINGIDNVSENYKKRVIEKYSLKLDKINFTAEQAISLIKQAGGVAIWAHPFIAYSDSEYRKLSIIEIEKTLQILTEYGLDGIESDYLAFDKEQTVFLQELANKNNLLISAGSDFHGYRDRDKFIFNSNPSVITMVKKLLTNNF